MARISKGKFRYLRDLFGYNDFVMYRDYATGYSTGYHRGTVYRNMYPVSAKSSNTIELPFDCTGINVVLNYRTEV